MTSDLLSKEPPYPSQNTVLLGVVGVVFAGDFKNGGESSRVRIDSVSDLVGNLGDFGSVYVRLVGAPWETPGDSAPLTDMLVDQDDADVLALLGEGIKGGLDGRRLRLAVDDEEVFLRVGRVGDMLRVAVSRSVICMTTTPLMQTDILPMRE